VVYFGTNGLSQAKRLAGRSERTQFLALNETFSRGKYIHALFTYMFNGKFKKSRLKYDEYFYFGLMKLIYRKDITQFLLIVLVKYLFDLECV